MRLYEIFKVGLGTAVVVQAASLIAERNDVSRHIGRRQQAAVIETSEFLRRAKHASAVCGDFVYIDGGDFSYKLSGVTNFQYASTILAIDLSTSWVNSTVVIHSTSKPSGAPDLDQGSLWCNPQTGSLIAGLTGTAPGFMSPPVLPSLSLWTFAPDNTGSGSWTQLLGSDSTALSSIVRPYGGQMAVGKDSAYILGGLTIPNVTVNSYLNGTPLSGILAFNMTTSTFTNSSADGYSPDGTAELGVLHYVPAFGPDGVFVAMGGDVSGLGSYTPGHSLKSFGDLAVFDPSTGTFYNQTATGNLPEPRVQFCTAGVASSNGTYEIFLYAGWNTNLGSPAIPFDEVYILTLPAFEWIKVDYPPANPRHLHSCHTVGNRQMLVIGGVDSSKTSGAADLDEDTFTTQDIFAQGLGIFDMTTLAFSDSYNASAEAYVQSDPVQSYYASNSKAPAAWGSSALEALFQITHFPNATTSTPASSSSASSSSATISPSSKPKSSNTGAIAGGVVGGVVILAVIAGAAFFCYRRRKKSSNVELQAAEQQPHFPHYSSQLDGHEVKPVYEAYGSLQNDPNNQVYETYGSQDASQQHRGVFGPNKKGNIQQHHMSTRVELP